MSGTGTQRTTGPPPAFRIDIHLIWIRIQHFRLNTDPDPDPIRILGFDDQNLKKNYSWKKTKFSEPKTTIYLSLGLHKGRPSYRRSLQPSKENIQHFNKWNFLIFFSTFVGNFALLESDPYSGSGSIDPIEFGSNPDPDPDPQHSLMGSFITQCGLKMKLQMSGTQRTTSPPPHRNSYLYSHNNFSFIISAVTKHEERDIYYFEYLSLTTITFALVSASRKKRHALWK